MVDLKCEDRHLIEFKKWIPSGPHHKSSTNNWPAGGAGGDQEPLLGQGRRQGPGQGQEVCWKNRRQEGRKTAGVKTRACQELSLSNCILSASICLTHHSHNCLNPPLVFDFCFLMDWRILVEKVFFPCDFVYRKIMIIFPTSGSFRNILQNNF